MKNSKIIKNVYVVFICLAAVALICLNIYQHQKIIRLSQSIKRTPVNPAPSTDQTSKDKGASLSNPAKDIRRNEADDLSYQLAAATEELGMVHKELFDEAARDILSESQAAQFEAYLKENRDRYESSLKESFGDN